MKYFLQRVLRKLTTTFLSVYLIIWISIQIYPDYFLGDYYEYTMWDNQIKNIKLSNKQKLNVIVGDSRAMSGLRPKMLSGNFYNFSFGGATFFEGYLSLKEITKNNNIDTLLLCYGPYHFERANVLSERTCKFGLVKFTDLINLYNLEIKFNKCAEYKELNKNHLHSLMKRILYLYHVPFLFRSEYIYNLFREIDKSVKSNILLTMNKEKGYMHFGLSDSTKIESAEAKESIFIPNKIIISYLDSILILSNKHNIKVFFTSPPTSFITYNKGKKKYYQTFDDYLGNLQIQHGLNIINKTMVYPNNLYGDQDHLNMNGSDSFTRFINSIL
jgi:hypothetical protein